MNTPHSAVHVTNDCLATARRLTRAAGYAVACIGLYNCQEHRFVDVHVGHDEEFNHPSETTALEVTTGLLRTLIASDDLEPPGTPDSDGIWWAGSSRSLIGIGKQVGAVRPVAAFVGQASDRMDRLEEQQLLQIGLAYAIRLLKEELEDSRSSRERIADAILRSLSIDFAVVDPQGGIDYTSDICPTWLADRCQIDIVGDRLVARSTKAHQRLLSAIEHATSQMGQTSILQIEGEDGRPQSIIVLPIGRQKPQALIVFGQDKTDAVMRDLLLETLGLTLAERRLARHLLSGKSLADAAEEMCLTISTTRSYLKRIFAKTGINRQSQFIALYHTMMPPVRATGQPRP